MLYDGLLAMLEYLCDCFFTCCGRIKHHYIYITLTLCYPACAHHRTTLSIRLLAVGFNNLDGCSGLFRPAWVPGPVLVSGTRTGSRTVAQPSNGWLLHGNPCACLIPAREAVLVFTLLTSTGSRVLASAYVQCRPR